LALQGRLDDSLEVLGESHRRLQAVLGEDHWRTVNVVRNIGWILALQRRDAEALKWMDRALASLRRMAHLEHRKMRFHVQGRRARILLRLGHPKEAVEILESTLAAHTEAKVPGSEYIGTDLRMGMALVLLETGRAAGAVPHARAAVAAVEREPMHDPTRAQAECLLGGALVQSGAAAEGRALLDRCLPVYRAWGLADTRLVASLDAIRAR
jgi:Tetratricopeptide repeat